MGTSGSGNISDYPGSSKKGGGSGGDDGGPSSDRCDRAISVRLEDIEHCDYYIAHGTVPPTGQPLRIAHKKRIVAQTEEGLTVGNLPTSYNYLGSCLRAGWSYAGVVTSSASGPPTATVSADFGVESAP